MGVCISDKKIDEFEKELNKNIDDMDKPAIYAGSKDIENMNINDKPAIYAENRDVENMSMNDNPATENNDLKNKMTNQPSMLGSRE